MASDLPKGAAFGFELKQIVVGQNRHGENVTTCTVEATSGGSPGSTNPRLTPDERGWLADITAFFDDPARVNEGVRPTPESPQIRGATRAKMRAWLVTRGRLGVAGSVAGDGGLSASDRSNLSRYLNRLKDKGKIGMYSDWIWLR